MGRQAKLRASRRQLLREHTEQLAVINQGKQEKQDAIAQAFDETCAALLQRDRAVQSRRLETAAWKLVSPNADGIGHWRHRGRRLSLIHSVAREADGQVWAHVSVGTPGNTMPGWYEVRDAGWLLYPGEFGVVVVAPQDSHVNLSNVGHVWYCLTAPAVPDFSRGLGSI